MLFQKKDVERACFFDESGDEMPGVSKKYAVSLTVLDLEITQEQFLIGIYFVNTNKYVPISFFKNMDIKNFEIQFQMIVLFFKHFSSSYCFEENNITKKESFNNLFENKNDFKIDNQTICIQPALLTFNGYYFDIPLITLFLNGIESFFQTSFLENSTQQMLEEEKMRNQQNQNETTQIRYNRKLKFISQYTKALIEENKKLEISHFNKKTTDQDIFHFDLLRILNDENKSTSLEALKNKHFIDTCLEKWEIEKPIEYLKNIENKQQTVLENEIFKWFQYNANDCFYTACVFLKTKVFRDSFVSKFLLYKLMPIRSITFASSINTKKGRLVVSFLKQKGVDVQKVAKKDTLLFKDLTILHEYPLALKTYKSFFERHDYIKDTLRETSYPFFNSSLQFSTGGLHSKFEQNFLYFETNDDEIVLDVDVAGYYVELLRQICTKMKFLELSSEIETLNSKSLELKKQGKTNLRTPIKIILLSVTGNLNAKNNFEFYAPNLYFSITSNGQLMITELLFTIQSFIQKFIFVNTDGFCVIIKKQNVNSFQKLLKAFELKYNVELEQTIIQRGLVKDVNNYVFL